MENKDAEPAGHFLPVHMSSSGALLYHAAERNREGKPEVKRDRGGAGTPITGCPVISQNWEAGTDTEHAQRKRWRTCGCSCSLPERAPPESVHLLATVKDFSTTVWMAEEAATRISSGEWALGQQGMEVSGLGIPDYLAAGAVQGMAYPAAVTSRPRT